VHTKDGKDVTVSLKDKYAALAVVKSSMDEIKEGTFIDTATEPQPDGSLRAVEVVVFPETLRGFAELSLGPWAEKHDDQRDHCSKGPKSGRGNRRRNLQGRRRKITIPSNIPIVGLLPSEHGDIEPGAHVFVPTEKQPDGTLLAGAVLFGKGVVPPM
jgi:hypothetical protein